MRKSRLILIALAVCVVLAAVFHTAILAALGTYLVRAQPPRKCDIALILAGDDSGNRVLKGGEMVKDGYAPLALVSGPAGMYGYYESDLAIPFAVKAGFPAADFAGIPNHSHSTKEEAEAMLPELRRRGVHSVLLVTSDYHTRRAARVYRELAPDLQFDVVAAPDEYFTPTGWWHNRQARKTFAIEWMKTVAEWFGL